MRKIIFSIPVTLDGYIEGPNHELNWVAADDELHDFATNLLRSADLLLYGRVTYELMASYWPIAPQDPQTTLSMLRFAQTLNPMRKIVFSTTLNEPGWNTQVIRSFNPDEIREMKNQDGKDILLSGGAMIAHEFIKHGLIDEYQPIIQPAIIGTGKALFGDVPNMLRLDFQWSRRFTSGAVALCYRSTGKVSIT